MRKTKRTTRYLTGTKEEAYESGLELGLKDDALDKYCYSLHELKVELLVDMLTGESVVVEVDGRKVS